MSSNDPNDIKYSRQVDTSDKEMVSKLIDENKSLKQKLEKVTKIAENLANYYGSSLSWRYSPLGSIWYEGTIHEDDIEDMGNYYRGGKLARQKQKEFKEILK